MLAARGLIAAFMVFMGLALAGPFAFAATPSPDPLVQKQWSRLYLYEPKLTGGVKSASRQGPFFFSPEGASNPAAEMKAAIAAFESGAKAGAMGLPAACAYPARKLVLEKLLGREFPQSSCPELDQWLKGLDADHVSILFAGAFAKNPVSLFGHTILRLSNEEKERARGGNPLLSYAVGFLARTNPEDTKVEYVMNGFFGGYLGFYEIQPFYMKLGLYNNSESRDLWEHDLALSKDEVRLLQLHLWETSINAEVPYYFAEKNCSYRLLTLLEAIRPDLDLTKGLGYVSLPYETVRALSDAGLTKAEPRFYSSIGRRHALRLKSMNKTQLQSYRKGLASTELVAGLKDPLVLDAMIDHWTHENYKKLTLLASNERSLMETTFSQRAAVREASSALPPDASIAAKARLRPASEGHRPQWIAVSPLLGSRALRLAYRMGAHALWQRGTGFDGFAAIEYLGFDFDYDFEEKRERDWLLRVADIRSLEDFSWDFPSPSWKVTVDAKKTCAVCASENVFSVTGGVGLSQHLLTRRLSLFAMTDLELAASGAEAVAAPGFDIGAKYDAGRARFVTGFRPQWWRDRRALTYSAKLAFDLDDRTSALASYAVTAGTRDEREARLALERGF